MECGLDFTFIIAGQERIVNDAENVGKIIFQKFCCQVRIDSSKLRKQGVFIPRNNPKTLGQRIGYRPEVFRLEVPQVGCQ